MRQLTPEERMQLKTRLEQTRSEKTSKPLGRKRGNSKERLTGIVILVLAIAVIIGTVARLTGPMRLTRTKYTGGTWGLRSSQAETTKSGRLEVPKELATGKILVGRDILKKELFYQHSQIGSVTDISNGEHDPTDGPEIVIAGTGGAAFVKRGGGSGRFVPFRGLRTNHVDVVDIEGDGICEFLNRGSWSVPAALIDHKGKFLWTYRGSSGVDDAAAGDVDGDGSLEIVVGFNGSGGVHLLDSKGKKIWEYKDRNVWHVEIVDVDGDGSLEIAHSNADGRITVRDKEGHVLSRNRPFPYFSHFSLTRWIGRKRQFALLAENDKIWVLDFDATVVAQMDAPFCGRLGHARGTLLHPGSNEPEHYATLVTFRNWHRAILYLHDSSGKLVYQEIIPENCEAVSALAPEEGATDVLLVGAKGKVWKYSFGVAADSQSNRRE